MKRERWGYQFPSIMICIVRIKSQVCPIPFTVHIAREFGSIPLEDCELSYFHFIKRNIMLIGGMELLDILWAVAYIAFFLAVTHKFFSWYFGYFWNKGFQDQLRSLSLETAGKYGQRWLVNYSYSRVQIQNLDSTITILIWKECFRVTIFGIPIPNVACLVIWLSSYYFFCFQRWHELELERFRKYGRIYG